MANTHLVYPGLAIGKISGTDPHQDAESFVQLIERKINFAHGDTPGHAGERANYTLRKKALFSSLLQGPAAEWYENNTTNATTWEIVRTILIIRFSDSDTSWKWSIVLQGMEKKFETAYAVSTERLIKAGPMI